MTETETDRWAVEVENETMPDTPVAALREWAQGLYPLEAATELLIRGGFAQRWRPWVLERDGGGWWIDFPRIPDHLGELSGGERRLLRIAASLGADGDEQVAIALEECVTGLDRRNLALVLAAIAHAGGSHEWPVTERRLVRASDGLDHEVEVPMPGAGYAAPLIGWPS